MSTLEERKTELVIPAGPRLRSERLLRYLPLILLAAVIIVLGLTVPYFLTPQNVVNVLMQASALGLMAIGMTAVMVSGGIDLSIPSIMAFSGIVGAMFMREGGSPLLAAVIMIGVALLGGTINGFAVAYLRMIPFVVTLSMMAIVMGASIAVTGAQSIGGLPESFADTVLAKVGIIPVPVIFLLLMTIVTQLFVRRSIFGRWLYAVGTNVKAARVSGIPTQRVIFLTYVFSGLMAGLAAIITTARLGAAAATIGREGVVLDVVSSAVLGGVSIYGGIGTPLDAVIGAILITLISNSLNMMQASYYLTLVVKGLVIIGVVALDSFRRR